MFWTSAVINPSPYIKGAPELLTTSSFLLKEYSLLASGTKFPPVSKVTCFPEIVSIFAFENSTISDEPDNISTVSPTFNADLSGLVFKL